MEGLVVAEPAAMVRVAVDLEAVVGLEDGKAKL